MFHLVVRALRLHLDANMSVPINFWAAIAGMCVNNIFFLYGMWLMLFDGKEQNQAIFPYYLTLVAIVYSAWGIVMSLGYGLRHLADRIDDGSLESILGTPRHPLLLAALNESSPAPLGDLFQGIITWLALFWVAPPDFVFRALALIAVSTVGFCAVFIFAGSLAFFLERGAALSSLLIESTLSLSIYPTGKILQGYSRYVLYLSPAFFVAVLPMQAIETADPLYFAVSFGLAILSFWLSVGFFQLGLRRYRSANFIGVNR